MGVILCEFESRPPHSISHEEVSKEASSFFVYIRILATPFGATWTSGCFISCPPEPTISWTEVDFDTVCPQKPVFSWTGAAQSMRSEPFGVARAACFEQLAGVFASCGAPHYAKILASLKIKDGISLDTSKLRSERLYRF